ncbi:MAG: 5-formyltetrahydrofolate cyclo-ligase [Nitrospiria bacterium]
MRGCFLYGASPKKEIRSKLLHLRRGLTAAAREEKSREITKRLLVMPVFSAAQSIHFYLSNPKEVQTDSMIREALRVGKRIVVPVVHPEDRSLSFSELADFNPNKMQLGPFGIRHPRPPFIKEVALSEVDLWIVPGVAFDSCGSRIGYGGGYYDRVLSHVKEEVIGLAFECQMVEGLPIDENDRPVDKVITERRTIDCR